MPPPLIAWRRSFQGESYLQDEGDAGQRLTIVDRLASWEANPSGLWLGQKRFDAFPEFIL